MKKTYSILCAFVLAGSFFGCSTTQQKTSETDYTQYVNTFIGAADNGHTFPGACRPFSMIQTLSLIHISPLPEDMTNLIDKWRNYISNREEL